jgi:ABC-type sulfate/molybdate transport systems ATPase subunit
LRVSLREEFTQHIAQAAIPTLLVTHDASEARAMASRAVKLVDGRLIAAP